ncbi:MAG: PDZ domain-containing protein [Gaiellaceae bacterium]
MRRVLIFVALSIVSISLAGCGGGSGSKKSTTTGATSATSTTLPAAVPKPNLAKIVPANYVVQKIRYAKLSGQATPDAVVVSKGPATGDFGFHPAQLQVISWDAIAERWNVIYDAQKDKEFQVQYGTNGSNQYITSPPDLETASTPILDRTADGDVEQIAFVRFGTEKKLDLVFSTTQNYGGSGSPGNIVVIGFDRGEANLRYLWFGDGGAGFEVVGSGAKQTLAASAQFWTPVDAHCCAIRDYSFVVGDAGEHTITSLRDDRPWLGLFVEAVREGASDSPLAVVDVLDGSPAASLFQQGDVITGIVGAKKSENQGSLGPALIDQLALEKAGSRVTIRVDRGGAMKTVTVKLGSYIDPSAQNAEPPSDLSIMAI